MVAGSLLTRRQVPPDVGRVMVRLHAPEALAAELQALPRT
jgi:cation/acetate symporter